MMPDQLVFFVTAILIIFMGLLAVSISKNMIKSVMSFQVIVFGVNLALFASGLAQSTRLMADTMVFVSILVGASVEAVGLAVVVNVYRKYGTLDPTKIRRLRG
jgi:multicomponent Na+:H+ antiporter subunit C